MERTRRIDPLFSGGPRLSVNLTAGDLMALGETVRLLEGEGVELLHIDVMDGHFSPQITVGAAFVRAIRTRALKDVHLMVDEPLARVADFVKAGADLVTFHVESTPHPHRVLRALAELARPVDAGSSVARGVAINPGTAPTAVEPLLGEMDLLVLLAVDPGWPGQVPMSTLRSRVAGARAMIGASGRQVLLGIDGGVTRQNISEFAAMLPDIIVSGSAVFDGGRTAENLRAMKEQMSSAVALARAQ